MSSESTLEEKITNFLNERNAACIVDIARKLKIHPVTASDLVHFLAERGKVEIEDKKIVKIVKLKR